MRARRRGDAGQAARRRTFPIQFQNDFLKAQGSRVWVPITLTLDPAKTPSGALTLYLRVAPRGMTAPPPPRAGRRARQERERQQEGQGQEERQERRGRRAGRRAELSVRRRRRSSTSSRRRPGQPLRIQRGIGVPAGSYDLYIVLHERGGRSGAGTRRRPGGRPGPRQDVGPEAAAGRAQLRVRRPRHEHASSSPSASTQLPAPITPDAAVGAPLRVRARPRSSSSPDHKFKKSQELIVLLQIYNPMVTPEKKFNLEATYTFYGRTAGPRSASTAPSRRPSVPTRWAAGSIRRATAASRPARGCPSRASRKETYRLEIKITDKLSTKVLTQNVELHGDAVGRAVTEGSHGTPDRASRGGGDRRVDGGAASAQARSAVSARRFRTSRSASRSAASRARHRRSRRPARRRHGLGPRRHHRAWRPPTCAAAS